MQNIHRTSSLRTIFAPTLVAPMFVVALNLVICCANCFADGKVVKPKNYHGSLEELSQEAIMILQRPGQGRSAIQDLILKITVEGEAETFAWIVPFPNEPETFEEDPKLFKEIFNYVQARTTSRSGTKSGNRIGASLGAETDSAVNVISRKTVGNFDVAVVRENEAGGLNQWLEENDYQTLQDAEDVLDFYRRKKYVFACIKIDSKILSEEKQIDSHPLRFRFKTGGQDGIYFPMKLTGLQDEPFDVNLYVFYPAWINDDLNQFGFKHRGFDLVFRDYDSPNCDPNAGKTYSSPGSDRYLKPYKSMMPSVTELFQRLFPGGKFYMTNIQAKNFKPKQVRQWPDDLWLFPYYVDKSFVPLDIRDQGPASEAWPNLENQSISSLGTGPADGQGSKSYLYGLAVSLTALISFTAIGIFLASRKRAKP